MARVTAGASAAAAAAAGGGGKPGNLQALSTPTHMAFRIPVDMFPTSDHHDVTEETAGSKNAVLLETLWSICQLRDQWNCA